MISSVYPKKCCLSLQHAPKFTKLMTRETMYAIGSDSFYPFYVLLGQQTGKTYGETQCDGLSTMLNIASPIWAPAGTEEVIHDGSNPINH